MRETTFTESLLALCSPASPEIAEEIIRAISGYLPEPAATALTGQQIWGIRPRGTSAPDGLYRRDAKVLLVLEAKSLTAWANWVPLSRLRTATVRDDEAARGLYQNLVTGSPQFDELHSFDECRRSCCRWTPPKAAPDRPGRQEHQAAVHQGDIYALTTNFLPDGVTFAQQPAFVFLSPHEKATGDWLDGLASDALWHIVPIPELLDRWRQRMKSVRELSALAALTEAFLYGPRRS